ncbi:MAG TPA: hypothetical protein VHO06_21060 [Polyangia bacterium]|nr:hypothetical protein [Polyangia bacterium]
MGAHKSNPHAEGYVLGSARTPPVQISAHLDCEVIPSQEWLDENPADPETGKRPECPPERAEVRFLIMGAMVIPSAVRAKKDWAAGFGPVAEIHRMRWQEFALLLIRENPQLAPVLNGPTPVQGEEN